jgi:hypothetical protein
MLHPVVQWKFTAYLLAVLFYIGYSMFLRNVGELQHYTCHIPEDCTLCSHWYEDLTSYRM